MTNANSLSRGDIIVFENSPFKVLNNDFHKPGKGRPVNRLKLKHLSSNHNREVTTSPDQMFSFANVEEEKSTFIYSDDLYSNFMNTNTLEMEIVPNNIVEDVKYFLVPELEFTIVKYNGKVISVIPPIFVDLKIAETENCVKGGQERLYNDYKD